VVRRTLRITAAVAAVLVFGAVAALARRVANELTYVDL
jgi:hypothetical protein